MIDKVQLIKEEIERRISQFEAKYPKDLGGYWNDEESAAYDCAEEYKRFLLFIDSIPEESASEDLEEEINRVDDWYPVELNYIQEIAHHFVEWQKQKDYKMYAHVPLKDIHDAWQELKTNKPDIENYPSVCFQKGADWRENQIKETLQTEYEKGRFDMREEMMKDSVGGEVVYQIGSSIIAPTDVRYKVMSDRVYIPNIKLGDKVKIIIVKEEQQ